jgi:hypothetical protein
MYRIAATVDNYVIYDPLFKMDKRHVMQYRKEANLIPIRIPCGGHTPTILLAECGMLTEFILRLIAGRFCGWRFRDAFKQAQRSSPQYWEELKDRLLGRGRRGPPKRITESAESMKKIGISIESPQI